MADDTAERFDLDARTVPGDRRAGGRRVRVARGAGRRRPPADASPSWPSAVDEAARAFIARGVEPGDRVAIWAPNIGRVGRRRARRPPGRGGRRHRQHPLQGRRGGPRLSHRRARMLLTVTDFLDTDYVALLGRGRARPTASSEIVVLARAACPTAPSRGPTSSPAPPQSIPADVGRAGRRRSTPTTSATSSSRRAPPGSPRARCCATRRSVRAFHAWADGGRPAPRATAT